MGIKPTSVRPYAKIITKELILRDHLAADRTILANERTFLSYIRTSLTIIVVGLSLIKFFMSLFSQILGMSLILGGIGVGAIGLLRYREIRTMIDNIKNKQVKNSEVIEKISSPMVGKKLSISD